MAKRTLGELYGDHLKAVCALADKALAAGGYDGLITCSGRQVYYYLDDSTYPFRPNPRYRYWLPDATPDCFVVYRPGRRPMLVFNQPDDYWFLPPEAPEGYWVAHFDVKVVRSPAELGKLAGKARWAVLGEPAPATEGLGDHDPPAVTGPLDYARAVKSPYEVECMALATAAGVRAHRAGAAAFPSGAAE
jgi:Xaa-Pro dipeptidase